LIRTGLELDSWLSETVSTAGVVGVGLVGAEIVGGEVTGADGVGETASLETLLWPGVVTVFSLEIAVLPLASLPQALK